MGHSAIKIFGGGSTNSHSNPAICHKMLTHRFKHVYGKDRQINVLCICIHAKASFLLECPEEHVLSEEWQPTIQSALISMIESGINTVWFGLNAKLRPAIAS